MLAVLCGASSFVAPVSPARSVVAQAAGGGDGPLPGLLKTVEFLNKPADEDDGEGVLDTESEAGYTFKCGPATPPSYGWWYKYDWPGAEPGGFGRSEDYWRRRSLRGRLVYKLVVLSIQPPMSDEDGERLRTAACRRRTAGRSPSAAGMRASAGWAAPPPAAAPPAPHPGAPPP